MKVYKNGSILVDDEIPCFLFYIIEPGKKVYYSGEEDLHLWCVVDKRKAMIFYSESSASSVADHIKLVYNVDMNIERL